MTIFILVLLVVVVRLLSRWAPAQTVSARWLESHAQRDGHGGVDQSCVRQWPVKKGMNEAATFNAQKLRKRA
jgi:hypothetical protein